MKLLLCVLLISSHLRAANLDLKAVTTDAMLYKEFEVSEKATVYTIRNKKVFAQRTIERNEKNLARKNRIWAETEGRSPSIWEMNRAKNLLEQSLFVLKVLNLQESSTLRLIDLRKLQFTAETNTKKNFRKELSRAYVTYYEALVKQEDLEIERLERLLDYHKWVENMQRELAATPAGALAHLEAAQLVTYGAAGKLNQAKSRRKAASEGIEDFHDLGK